MRRALLAILLLSASPALGVEEADRTAIRGLVERQIDAFRRDDAGVAYAAASPGIQRLFPGEERFMAMVREGYRPVYRPRSYSFDRDEDGPDGPLQALRVQDEDGADWLAIYSFERQPDGTWRISGCRLVKAPGQAA